MVAVFPLPGQCLNPSIPLIRSNPLSQSASIQWPGNNINLSQLQSIFAQNPGLNMLNVQFPNQTSWGVTPNLLQGITNTLQAESQSVGIGGKLPDLVLSSLAGSGNGLSAGLPQLSIANLNPDTLKSQMDNVLTQMRNGDLGGMLNWMPDWLKNIILTIYNAVYSCFDFLGNQIQSLYR